MTELLLRLFIREKEGGDAAQTRAAYGKLAGIVGICCNVLLFAAKLCIGTLSASVSITADAINNLSDASSNIVSLLGFKLGSRPADDEHPYGHARYEYLAGLMVAVMILVIGIELFKSSFQKILHPEPVEFGAALVIVLALSVAVKFWMMLFNRAVGKKINSQTLMATAADSRNDVITTLAVLLAAVVSAASGLELDGFMGVAVSLFICYSGFGLVRDTLDPLIGRAPDAETVTQIKERIMSYPGVLGTHDLMIHDYGPGRQFASVHVEVAAEADVLLSHDMIDNIERDFHRDMDLHLVVHMDPIVTGDSRVNDMRNWLAEHVGQIEPGITVHDLRIVPGTTHTNLIFDCVVPHSLIGKETEVKRRISELVAKEFPQYFCVITVEHSFTVVHQAEDDEK